MPIYEYECGYCHCHFDLRQGFNDEAKAACPQCQRRARRVFQPSPIIFKGSGFYVNDYPKAGSEPKKTKVKTAEKPEAKPEAKKEESKGK